MIFPDIGAGGWQATEKPDTIPTYLNSEWGFLL